MYNPSTIHLDPNFQRDIQSTCVLHILEPTAAIRLHKVPPGEKKWISQMTSLHVFHGLDSQHWSNSFLKGYTLLGTNISPEKSMLKMIFLFPRWDMLISWRVVTLFEIVWFWTMSHYFAQIHLVTWEKKTCVVLLWSMTQNERCFNKHHRFLQGNCVNNLRKTSSEKYVLKWHFNWLHSLWFLPLMDEILHHLTCMKPCKYMTPTWISEPSTVLPRSSDSSPFFRHLKSYRDPKGEDRFLTIIFSGAELLILAYQNPQTPKPRGLNWLNCHCPLRRTPCPNDFNRRSGEGLDNLRRSDYGSGTKSVSE